jgi:hypothetical protein
MFTVQLRNEALWSIETTHEPTTPVPFYTGTHALPGEEALWLLAAAAWACKYAGSILFSHIEQSGGGRSSAPV